MRPGVTCALGLACVLSALAAPPEPNRPADAGRAASRPAEPEIAAIVAAMARQRKSFQPRPLCSMTKAELSALLDHLLPETKFLEPLTSAKVGRLIRQLGDNDYWTRERATEELIAGGQPFAQQVRIAAQSEDPEIQARAQAILRAWQTTRPTGHQYHEAFAAYLKHLKDKDALRELARRLSVALRSGGPGRPGSKLLAHALHRLAVTKDRQCLDLILPVMTEARPDVAVWTLRYVALSMRRDYRAAKVLFLPALLKAALQSEREAVVDAGLGCAPEHRSPEVKKLVVRIFEGGSEKLKFHACFPLMHDYRDPRAIPYLLTQVDSSDKARARRAIHWIGDACNFGRKATPAILAKLVPLLKSKDNAMRRAATDALGTYSGEQVVRSLIPMLADPVPIIAAEAASGLRDQPQRALVRRLLGEAAAGTADPELRQKIMALLSKLPEK